MADKTVHSRSHGISAEGVKDQYADGAAAKVWEFFIGDIGARTDVYRNFLVGLLRGKGCRRVLDAACGTGVDSMMLLEDGFDVISVDASDKMLKYALKYRWNRRKEPRFDNWVIEEANWLSLYNDLGSVRKDGFDALFCLGNSFAHLLDNYGDQREQRLAIKNFADCLKPGGLLIIDHRNFDHVTDQNGSVPSKSIYYNSPHKPVIKTSVLIESGKPQMVMLDYVLRIPTKLLNDGSKYDDDELNTSAFRLSYYPHKLADFSRMLKLTFGVEAKHEIFGDFQKIGEIENPAYYIHVIEKPKL